MKLSYAQDAGIQFNCAELYGVFAVIFAMVDEFMGRDVFPGMTSMLTMIMLLHILRGVYFYSRTTPEAFDREANLEFGDFIMMGLRLKSVPITADSKKDARQ